ncbi:MAG: class I SAM-dependent rRNA methyltransferase [Planctomycetota bacterium]|nr:class I SAM-dependent rRNA methyltransferase [Planctomycetota bacterium]
MSSSHEAVWLRLGAEPRGPHVYGREVDEPSGDGPEPGSLVEVFDDRDRFLGHALYNPWSDIRLRWISRGRRKELDRPAEFLLRTIAAADRLRRKGLRLEECTDAYRIIHAEGDDMPGLILDRLGEVLVAEYHSLGFWKLRGEIEKALAQLYPGRLVVHKVARLAVRREGFDDREPLMMASDGRAGRELEDLTVEFTERGVVHRVHPGHGHKTGWFCDQRENRLKLAELSRGRAVLDLCCNAGGFALQAKRLGARHVTAVDLDEVVLDKAVWSAERNQLDVEFVHDDIFRYLRGRRDNHEPAPEVVILDPHKIIATRNSIDDGLETYGDMNALALETVRSGGILATFSCSGPLDLATFLGMVFKSARRAEREVRLLEVLGAPADHPQRPDFPRSRYLKGALLSVD